MLYYINVLRFESFGFIKQRIVAMKIEAESGFAGNFNSDDEADLHTFFLESMKKNPEFLKTQYAVFQKEQPFLNELLENLEESVAPCDLDPDFFKEVRDFIVIKYCSFRNSHILLPIDREKIEQYSQLISADDCDKKTAFFPSKINFAELSKQDQQAVNKIENIVRAITVALCSQVYESEDGDDFASNNGFSVIDYGEIRDFYYDSLKDTDVATKVNAANFMIMEVPFLADFLQGIETAFEKSAAFCNKKKKQSEEYHGSVQELILTAFCFASQSRAISEFDENDYESALEETRNLVNVLKKSTSRFHEELERYCEGEFLEFLYDVMVDLKLPSKVFDQKLAEVLAFGITLSGLQVFQDFCDIDCEEDDFDPEKLRAILLQVKLEDYNVKAEIQIRENQTFQDLHNCLLELFERNDDHLYCFECSDGTYIIRPEDDPAEYEEEYPILSDCCYIGHHIIRGVNCSYIFDFGEEWRHTIKFKKYQKIQPGIEYPYIVSVTGDIPEQYPDCEENNPF